MSSGGSGGRLPSGAIGAALGHGAPVCGGGGGGSGFGCGGGIGCGSRDGGGFGFGGGGGGGAGSEDVHRGRGAKDTELRGPEPEQDGTYVRGHVVDGILTRRHSHSWVRRDQYGSAMSVTLRADRPVRVAIGDAAAVDVLEVALFKSTDYLLNIAENAV